MNPTRVIAIASTARSGSTLLAQGVAATGQGGDPREWFNPASMFPLGAAEGVPRISPLGHVGRTVRRLRRDPRWHINHRFTRRSIKRYLDVMGRDATTGDGILAFKTQWNQYHPVVLRHGFDAGYWGADVQWVRTMRQDRVRQAVSFTRAVQTGLWTAGHNDSGTPTYDARYIAKRVKAIAQAEAGWDAHFARIRVTPLTVDYEQLDADYEGTMATVLAYLDINAPVPPRQVTRQGDALNDEWVARFRAEHPGA